MKILFITIVMRLLAGNDFLIDSLLKHLDSSHTIVLHNVKGKFNYIQSDETTNIYISLFKSKSFKIYYIHYGDENLKDTLCIGKNKIAIENKYDPLSIQVTKFSFQNIDYIVLLSKSESASGSGVQVSYYTLLEMKKKLAVQTYFFQSRFGSFFNIGDFNNDGELDYIKVVNGSSQNEFIAKLFSIKTNTPIKNYNIVLIHIWNDLFSLKSDNWFKKIDLK